MFLMESLVKIKKHISDAITNLQEAFNLIDKTTVKQTKERRKQTAVEGKTRIVWDGKTHTRTKGYKIHNRKSGDNRKQGQRWGKMTDPVARQELMEETIQFITSNKIHNRGELAKKNKALYMALYHRQMLDEIAINI